MNRIYPAWDELSDTHGELRELYEDMRADLTEARKPDCRACAFYYACVIGQHEVCTAGAGFDYARDPVRLYEKGKSK